MPITTDNPNRKKTESELAAELFEAIAASGKVIAGKFISVKDNQLTIPGETLKGCYTDRSFSITVIDNTTDECDEDDEDDEADYDPECGVCYPGCTAEILVSLPLEDMLIPNSAIFGAVGSLSTVSSDTSKTNRTIRTMSAYLDPATLGQHAPETIQACCLLEEVWLIALAITANDVGSYKPVRFREFDLEGCLLSHGFGQQSGKMATELREKSNAYEQIMIPYALPYNLDLFEENNLIDAIIAECRGSGWGLGWLTLKRFFFGEGIIRALQNRDYTPEQIAVIATMDPGLFHTAETKKMADDLCRRIENSSFDPQSPNSWSSYEALEDGDLVAFLGESPLTLEFLVGGMNSIRF